jgi:sugar phosphate isomerase/epimerase
VKISVIADEVSGDLETALELIRSWDVDGVELRRAGGRRYPDVNEYWRKRVPALVAEYGLPVAAISPGLFKIRYPGAPAPLHFHRSGDIEQFEREAAVERLLDHHVDVLLPASVEAAKQLGTDRIICFDFERDEDGDVPDGAVQVLRHAADVVAREGMILAIEVDLAISSSTAKLVRRVNHRGLRINWDPANAYRAGDDLPYPDGYTYVREFVRHVHFKDAWTNPRGKREWTLDGVIDWAGQMAALEADGFDGYISVEPHMRPQINACMRTLARIRALLSTNNTQQLPPQLVGTNVVEDVIGDLL